MTPTSDAPTPNPPAPNPPAPNPPAPDDSYVKLAMRNMVSKGAKSLKHFGLTLMGLLGVLVGLAYLTR
ncbi:MAG: DUF3285 domain-containing protein [Synechococcales cyanobacterium RU_4_20]|nr:DUF3285 domain-containing protein [Synechococcales cyanobacterium RU_4_20]NJR71098.1 DUF3285 domain-containing protein [Synechococcales cyanobacterium CRU_2_2]